MIMKTIKMFKMRRQRTGVMLFYILVYLLPVAAFACAPLTITLNSISTNSVQVCAASGAAVTVTFSGTSDGAGSGSTSITYRAELSDALGSFTTPVNIGSVVFSGCAPASQVINATIPAGTASGNFYRIRVANASNAIISATSGNIVVKNAQIVTGTITTPLCAGNAVSVPFTICGTFNAGNVFTAQLSSSAGTFTAPVDIGTLSGTSGGTISATIPSSTVTATLYRIRVISSNPSVTGNDNGVNITINAPFAAGAPYPVPVCQGGAIKVPYTVGAAPCATFNAGNVFTAQLSDAAGSFASPVSIGTLASTAAGTISATIPAGTALGTGYRIRIVSSNPVATSTVNIASGVQTKQMVAYAGGSYTINRSSGVDQFSSADNNDWFWWNDGRPPFVISYLTANAVGTSVSTGLTPATPGSAGIVIDPNGPADFSVFPGVQTGSVASPICPGSAVNVPFSIGVFGCASFNSSNDFTAELSDASGSFASPTTIGTLLNTTTGGVISATVPAGAAIGTGYRIRVVSSSPGLTGWDNGVDLVTQAITTTVIGSPFCANSNYSYSGVSFTVSCPSLINAGNVYSAELSAAAGTFPGTVIGTLSSSAASGTITVVIPTATTPSTSYRIRVTASNNAFTGFDNGTDLTINSCALTAPSFIETIGETSGQSGIYSIQLTPSGGYTVVGNAGTSNVNPGDYYPTVGYCNTQDIFLSNLNSDGSILWQKTYAVTAYNAYYHTLRHENTSDGGYIVAGCYDNGCSPSSSTCYTYPFLMKTQGDGTIQWSRRYDAYVDAFHWGGSAASVKPTTDGGYIVCGTNNEAYSVPYLMKTASDGTVTWKYSYGTNGGAICCTSIARAVRQTADGGYILLSPGGDYTMGGAFDLIKVTATGNTVSWSNHYHYGTGAGEGSGGGMDLQLTSDGGFIMVGNTLNASNNSIFLLKTSSTGVVSWGKAFMYNSFYGGGMSNAVQQTTDGGYIITGTTETLNGTHDGNVILVKATSAGALSWAKSFDIGTLERGIDVKQATDGGFAIAAYTSAYGNQGLFIRTDPSGNGTCCGTDITSIITVGNAGVTTGAVAYGTTPAALTTGSTAMSPAAGGTLSVNTICTSVSSSVLPSGLVAFNASLLENTTVLTSWTTTTETNSDYFIVERSGNAIDYKSIGKVRAAGTSASVHKYSYTDEHPLNGTSYYRLKQVDYDGKHIYSSSVMITISRLHPLAVSVYPNPAGSLLDCYIIVPEMERLTIQVTDALGSVVMKEDLKSAKGENIHRLNTSGLSQGMYFLIVADGEVQSQVKFIKQ